VTCLRPSNIDAGRHSRAILRLLVGRLQAAWPDVGLVLRADSGFARWRLLRRCEEHDVFYVVSLARNKVLERLAAPFTQVAEEHYQGTQRKVRHFPQIEYAAGRWDRPRRGIVKAERLEQGPNLRFVLTNLPDPPRGIDDGRSTPRSERENRIKERQLMLFATRASCHAFLANPFRLAAQRGGLRADRAPAAGGSQGHRTAKRSGRHHPPGTAEGGDPGGGQRPPRDAAPVQRISLAGSVPPHRRVVDLGGRAGRPQPGRVRCRPARLPPDRSDASARPDPTPAQPGSGLGGKEVLRAEPGQLTYSSNTPTPKPP